MDDCLICKRVGLARAGENPFFISEFEHSYFVLGDHQYFEGYSLLLLKEHVRELHELKMHVQQELFQEVMIAGNAIFEAFRPWKMNYSCYGNAEPHVHWHIFPRYEAEADHRRNPWLHSQDFKEHLVSEAKRREHIEKIRTRLKEGIE
jgi:diadenosine tetraphosphate (Ap4A) HIT family hydrolase